MGVDAKGILNKSISAREVFDVIVSKYDKDAQFDVRIDSYDNTESGGIHFKDGKDQRRLFYCIVPDGAEETEYNEIDHVSLSLGYWGNSTDIITTIVRTFGGYVDENDCDDIGFYYVPKTGDEEYEEYVKQRKVVESVLDEKLSTSDRVMIANQILKCKEQLKEIL
jgi:hypothetical protein